MNRRPDTALLLVGHGSTKNPDSSTPTRQLVEVIAAKGIFDEVHCCFWKEEPPLHDALRGIRSGAVFIVPNFISEGHFTQTVIPREMVLGGPITRRDGKTLFYCNPVGSHPSMTSVLLKRACETAQNISPSKTSLLIVGHGTPLNENSAQAVKSQVALIASKGLYAEVLPAYMEEPPYIGDWAAMTTQPNVVVIPFFISDGLHSYQDIPVLLGIREESGQPDSQVEVFTGNPHHLRGKNLFYGSAIGTDPTMAGVILDQVKSFEQEHFPV